MATSPLNVQPSSHVRSNSLPSRQHPITSDIDENLNRLRASQSASTSSSIGNQLNCLQDLYESVDMLLQLPLAQQVLAQEQLRKWVEQLLDGSLMPLDVCGTLKMLCCKQRNAHKNFNRFCAEEEELKGLLMSSSFSNDDETKAVISTVKQVEAATISVLESLLSFISGPEGESKSSRWSLVSKFMHQKRVICEEEEQKANEFENVDATLRSLIKSGNLKHVENVQNELQNSEMCIQDLYDGLESFFRRLIKVRVTVLNILNC
ncbi:hypothetical protein like AT2G17080 [Hibiscus trionum]|uniref:Uncharacterized protein n=1 Tax=Hibiscus trionum TaxID=183268 RepID=A0A9W7LL65_HIBTR|nr:hypothetical protein like AT2G17080 [Hibiscus trionum]